MFLSAGDGIEVLSPQGEALRSAPMVGAGALCAAQSSVYCAGADGAIWQLNRQTLMPQSILCGGPGVRDLMVCPHSLRLYALVGDADSVMMIDTKSGKPQIINRCGCNPRQLTLHQGVLAAAGGESGCIHLYEADTLQSRADISMPGPVYGAALHNDSVFALCLTPELNALLVIQSGALRTAVALEGMPGCLRFSKEMLFAATQGWIYAFSLDQMHALFRIRAPGRASALCVYEGGLLSYDPLSECVWTAQADASWRLFRSNIRAMAAG